MQRTIFLVQLPFRNLKTYFPAPSYFSAMERWYRRVVSTECTIPDAGLWEIPAWISWLRAAIQAAATQAGISICVQVEDLSCCPFDLEAVLEHLHSGERGDVYCFSPLTQNSLLASATAKAVREHGWIALAGGSTARYLDPTAFDSIFLGRVEGDFLTFERWFSKALGLRHSKRVRASPEVMAEHLKFDWVSPRYHTQTIYMRTFAHHGCPFACAFCADRDSGSLVVPPKLLEQELWSLASTFRARSALYVGDLTFGVSCDAIKNLRACLATVANRSGKVFRLIVQTNPALVTVNFAQQLRKLGVVLVELGIESGSFIAVQRTQKERPSTAWLAEKIRILHDAGLAIAANIIVGLPEDDEFDYGQTLDFVLRWRDLLWFNVYGYVPYPGTPLYERLVLDKRIRTWDFHEWCEGAELVFEPYTLASGCAYAWLIRILRAAIGSEDVPCTLH